MNLPRDDTTADDAQQTTTRRATLRSIGALSAGGIAVGLAGCSGEEGSTSTSTTGGGGGGEATAPPTSTPTSTPEEVASETNTSSDQYDYVNDRETLAAYQVESYSDSLSGLTGLVRNLTDESMGYVQIDVVFYDDDDVQVGSGLDNTNDLAAGSEWRFEAAYLETDADWATASITGLTGGL